MTPIQKARSRLLLRSPFFGTLLMTTPMVETRDAPTAATDMKKIYWNPTWFKDMPVEHVIFVLAHEVMHILFMHGLRRGKRDPKLWNWACDYAINWSLFENGLTMPTGDKAGLLDKQYAGMSAEQIYDLLKKDPSKQPKGGGDLDGDVMDADIGDGSPASVEAIEQRIRGQIAQAATAARLAGTMPAGLERLIDTLCKPQVNWAAQLRHYMTAHAKSSVTWLRRNRRFRSVYLPTRGGHEIDEIDVIIDTSGSMSQPEITAGCAEVKAIADDVGARRIRLIWCDTAVHEDVFEQGEALVFKPKGGGGTDMRVPLRYIEDKGYTPAVTILITDGETPWPDVPPPFPLIVCCTTTMPVPVGQEVRLDVRQV